MADIDLTRGEPSGDDAASERRRRRRERTASAKAESPSAGPTEIEVRTQLGRAFDGLAKQRETREDFELAEAIRETGDDMTEGFVTLTNAVNPLRLPIVIGLNLIITVMAFGRVGGILLGRMQERRLARQQAREAEAGTVTPEHYAVEME